MPVQVNSCFSTEFECLEEAVNIARAAAPRCGQYRAEVEAQICEINDDVSAWAREAASKHRRRWGVSGSLTEMDDIKALVGEAHGDARVFADRAVGLARDAVSLVEGNRDLVLDLEHLKIRMTDLRRPL